MITQDNFTSAEVNELILDISKGVSSSSGDVFFETLVLHLWKLYKMSYILVGRFNKTENTVTTIKFCYMGEIQDNFEYSLLHSPCSKVICDKSALYPKDVQDAFPKDDFFKEKGIHSYLGMRLVDSSGAGIGLLSCLHTKEILCPIRMHTILEIFASRASAELERIQHVKDLEEKVLLRTQELESALTKIKTQNEDQLVYFEKMSGLGSLISGFTHDLNSPIGLSITGISYIKSETKTLQTRIEDESLSKTTLLEFIDNVSSTATAMEKGLDKAKALVHSLKKISINQHHDDLSAIDLHEYLNDILLGLESKTKHTKIKIKNEVDSEIKVMAPSSMFFQVFSNLILNSLKHGFNPNEEGTINIHASYKNEQLEIFYEDSGKGMDTYTKEHIFEKFYTTEKDTGGSGLGMYILHQLIVENNKGKITLHSKPKEGVKFEILLPLKEA